MSIRQIGLVVDGKMTKAWDKIEGENVQSVEVQRRKKEKKSIRGNIRNWIKKGKRERLQDAWQQKIFSIRKAFASSENPEFT